MQCFFRSLPRTVSLNNRLRSLPPACIDGARNSHVHAGRSGAGVLLRLRAGCAAGACRGESVCRVAAQHAGAVPQAGQAVLRLAERGGGRGNHQRHLPVLRHCLEGRHTLAARGPLQRRRLLLRQGWVPGGIGMQGKGDDHDRVPRRQAAAVSSWTPRLWAALCRLPGRPRAR